MRARKAMPKLADQRGLTLVEMLAAMLSGAIVVGAIVALFALTLRQSSRLNDRVLADAKGRTALAVAVEELRSSCTGFGATAIQAPSTTPVSPLASLGSSNLWFLSAYGNSTSGNSSISAVTLHDINWTAVATSNTGKQYGTLTDYSFAGSGSPPYWTFPTLSTGNATSKVLAQDVIPLTSGTLFHYYRYETASTGQLVEAGANELATLAPEKKIAKVSIAYEQAAQPAEGHTPDTRVGHTTTYSAAVVLRFTPPESTSEGWACA